MKNAVTLILILSTLYVYAQNRLITTLGDVLMINKSYCVNVDLENTHDVALRIEGQNIRLFYDSEVMSFDRVFLNGQMSSQNYDFQLQTEKIGLQKVGNGQLTFDDNMGFVNYAVTAMDDYHHQLVIEPGVSIHVQTICFQKKANSIGDDRIVLANEGKTDQYSRAFVQVESSEVNTEILLPLNLLDLKDSGTIAFND